MSEPGDGRKRRIQSESVHTQDSEGGAAWDENDSGSTALTGAWLIGGEPAPDYAGEWGRVVDQCDAGSTAWEGNGAGRPTFSLNAVTNVGWTVVNPDSVQIEYIGPDSPGRKRLTEGDSDGSEESMGGGGGGMGGGGGGRYYPEQRG